VHDRRIDGVTHTFGNQGALFMNAMTWWDHETESVWSQPWGRAIGGELRGVELFVIPSKLTTWGDWKAAHPETLAMVNNAGQLGDARQRFRPNFVLGLLLEDQAKAYYYRDVAAAGLINDSFAGLPIVVWGNETSLQAYFRQLEGQVLTFERKGEVITDQETGSSWDLARGIAAEGPLRGTALQPLPSSSSFDWAWRDFYLESEFYSP
jgi:hypothetical protein